MDARHRDVLIALIREYIDSAEPVGSRALSQRYFPTLSPATIRNVMADLEAMGYLAQPHTSAGRVPTDQAYRLYVDSFPPAPSAKPAVPSESLPTRRSGLDGFMERTSSHLSEVTKLTGLLLAPPLKHTTLTRLELMDRGSIRMAPLNVHVARDATTVEREGAVGRERAQRAPTGPNAGAPGGGITDCFRWVALGPVATHCRLITQRSLVQIQPVQLGFTEGRPSRFLGPCSIQHCGPPQP